MSDGNRIAHHAKMLGRVRFESFVANLSCKGESAGKPDALQTLSYAWTKLRPDHLLGLAIALRPQGVVPGNFPTLKFDVVFQHEKRGIFRDDRIAFAQAHHFINDLVIASAVPVGLL